MRSLTFIIISIIGVSVGTVGTLIVLLACGVRGRIVALVLALALFLITLTVPWLLGMGMFPVWILAIAVLAAGGGYIEMRRTWRIMQPVIDRYKLQW